jgi:hypothetical protein
MVLEKINDIMTHSPEQNGGLKKQPQYDYCQVPRSLHPGNP